MSLALSGVEGLAAFAGLLVALVLGLVYGLFPLVLFLRYRQSADPQVAPREPDLLPTPAEDFNHEIGPVLADLGFGEAQRWTFQGFATNVVSDLCTMVDRRRRVMAVLNVLHVRRQGAFRLHSRMVEFASRSEDGRSVVTTNSRTAFLFTDLGPRRLFQFPTLFDIPLLLRAHEALVTRTLGDAPLRQPAETKDFPGRLRESIREVQEWQERSGWLQSSHNGKYRLTLKGAYIQTWAALPPFRRILRQRREAAGKRLLAELGLEGWKGPS